MNIKDMPLRPITMLFKNPHALEPAHEELELQDKVVLTYDARVYHADRCSDEGVHPKTMDYMHRVFKREVREDRWSKWPKNHATRGTFGLIDMTLKLLPYKVYIVWEYPEAFMHPEHTLELSDVLVELALGDRSRSPRDRTEVVRVEIARRL